MKRQPVDAQETLARDLLACQWTVFIQNTETPKMDLIRELRLRQWARQHFVLATERQESWHPVVLDEMRRRDIEISIADQPSFSAAATFSVGSKFVPLAPDSDWEEHSYGHSIRAPHFTANARNRVSQPASRTL